MYLDLWDTSTGGLGTLHLGGWSREVCLVTSLAWMWLETGRSSAALRAYLGIVGCTFEIRKRPAPPPSCPRQDLCHQYETRVMTMDIRSDRGMCLGSDQFTVHLVCGSAGGISEDAYWPGRPRNRLPK